MFEKQLKSPLRSPLLRAILAGGPSTQYMMQGMNLGVRASWSGFTMFANVLYQMTSFQQYAGSGVWTQDHGLVTATVGTDEFRAYISDSGLGMPAGTYTVDNPSGANIAFGTFSNPSAYTTGGYSTATSFTFTYPGSGMLALFVKGSLTNGSGNLIVALPGVSIATIKAGNVWNPAYLTFRTGLGSGPIRMMDWVGASGSVEQDWADRTPTNKISLNGGVGATIPYELQIDLANRLGVDPWFCLPPRATSAYVSSFGALVNSTLNPGCKAWIERGNETWNESNTSFAEGTRWVATLDFTKYTATADYATDTFTKNGHGLTNGTVIRCFTTRENNVSYNTSGGTEVDYRMTAGNLCVVYAATTNTFRLYREDGVTALPIASSQVNLTYCKETEAGKVFDVNGNYGALCIQDWNILDPILGVNGYNRLVVRQVANPSTLTGVLAVSGVSSRASYISGAPYNYSFYWAGKVAVSSGTFTPSVWVEAAKTMHFSVYAAGATPTESEIIAGTGAINHQTISALGTSGTGWQAATAVTGLSDGTSYKLYFLVVDTKKNWVSSQTVAASATLSNAFFYDSNANQAERDRDGTRTTSLARTTAFIAAGGGIPMWCYEGGYHNFDDAPTEVNTWLNGTYQESDEFAGALLDNLYRLASLGVKGHCYYSETTGNTFSIANAVTDVTDKRYLALSGLSGRVAVETALSVGNVAASEITSAPSLPYVVSALPAETGRTYAIVGGNSMGNYDISGNNLRMVATAGIDFGTPTANKVYVEAFRGHLSDQFEVTFSTGDSWYQADSKFAWSTITDTDTAAVNPTVGSVLTLNAGTAAVAGGGLWDMQGATRYTLSTATLSDTPASGTPFLFAAVIDKDNHATDYVTFVNWGSGTYVRFARSGGDFRVSTYFTAGVYIIVDATMVAGAQVYWCYGDGAATPTFYGGRNQTTSANSLVSGASGLTIDRTITVGNGTTDNTKHGSVQVVSRAGMTLADAKAIVAKMQAHHGIA